MNRKIHLLAFLLPFLAFQANADASDIPGAKSWLIHLEYQDEKNQKIPVDCRTVGEVRCQLQSQDEKVQLQVMARITQNQSGSMLDYKFKYESKDSQASAEGTILVQKDIELMLMNLPAGKLSARVREDIPEKSRLIPAR